MRFRFGWRKCPKGKKNIHNENYIDNQNEDIDDQVGIEEDLQSIVVNRQLDHEVNMTTRIIFLGDLEEIGGLYNLYLRSKGFEVFNFPSPNDCALIAQQKCTCSQDYACADIIIAQMDMDGMSGLELIKHQREKGCHTLPQNKAVISSKFTDRQKYEANALGCKILQKPFRLIDMMNWIKECEKNIPANRKLTPLTELMEAV